MSAPLSKLPFKRKALFQLTALCLVLPLCAVALRPVLAALDWSLVRLSWSEITAGQWALALLASAASFAAIGRYDVIIHRVLETGVPARAAQASGAAAIAISQVIGMGLISGTVARWRGLPNLSIVAAGSVTAMVSISFLGAWLALFAVAGLLAPTSLPLPPLAFHASLFSAICFVLYTALKRYLTIAGKRLRLPSLTAILALLFYTACDTGLAAFALWVLLPESAALSFATLFPVYLTCLGLSLISNTPGGVGPFEVTLLWALQGENVNEVLASLIAFRLIYFALPACIGVLYLIHPMKTKSRQRPSVLRARGLHAESSAGLQTGAPLITREGTLIGAKARTTQSSAMLFEPAICPEQSTAALKKTARNTATLPLFYKCSARCAAKLRQNHMSVARIAKDAVLDLHDCTLTLPARRSLRRKLNKAKKSGIVIAPLAIDASSATQILEIDKAWQQQNGPARGFSMGRVELGYMQKQTCLGAWLNGRLVAYISCHSGQKIWALDIMRNISDAPSGTMHALVWHAVQDAQRAGAHSFSLASAACAGAPLIQIIDRLSLRKSPHSVGLAQFKRSFAPHWRPLYAAAPNRLALWLSLWDVWQEVQDPPPLPNNQSNAQN
ncbi:phosphatidylglycerol lysyltransferase domain-containing protein [Planktotalea sp.]|uniref:phosphatidylglycerol lysyltransferase domain-containing protein n=1 Tax=Planktotalea sp. TaxID=2029877 RepID=UPI003D6AD47D